MQETALAKFLKQKGIEPTGSKAGDMELARPFFKNYEQYKKEKCNEQSLQQKTLEQRWREEDERYLYKNAGKVPLDVMANHLRRTQCAVQKRCNLMGLETRLK